MSYPVLFQYRKWHVGVWPFIQQGYGGWKDCSREAYDYLSQQPRFEARALCVCSEYDMYLLSNSDQAVESKGSDDTGGSVGMVVNDP